MNLELVKKQLFEMIYSMPYDIFKNFVSTFFDKLSDTDKEDFILFVNNFIKEKKENV